MAKKKIVEEVVTPEPEIVYVDREVPVESNWTIFGQIVAIVAASLAAIIAGVYSINFVTDTIETTKSVKAHIESADQWGQTESYKMQYFQSSIERLDREKADKPKPQPKQRLFSGLHTYTPGEVGPVGPQGVAGTVTGPGSSIETRCLNGGTYECIAQYDGSGNIVSRTCTKRSDGHNYCQ